VLFNNAAMAYFNWLEDITNEEWNRDLREEIDLSRIQKNTAASGPGQSSEYRAPNPLPSSPAD
jgi:hypothetical protein